MPTCLNSGDNAQGMPERLDYKTIESCEEFKLFLARRRRGTKPDSVTLMW